MIAEITNDGAQLAIPDSVKALVESRMGSSAWKQIDEAEDVMMQMVQPVCPLQHVFTPHLYTRVILMPKDTLLTSRIHLFEHPFFILEGVVSVWGDETGWVTLRAPHVGVTKPGTRRVLFMHTDVTWATAHLTDETDPDTIVKQVTYTGGKYAELWGAKACLCG